MESSVGVYRIDAPSGKSYVGMTCDSFANRWSGHLRKLRSDTHPCKGLSRAYRKYGEENLMFSIVEAMPLQEVTIELAAYISEREQFWWDALRNSGIELYNGRPTGRGSVFHTDESLSLIRNAALRRVDSIEKRKTFDYLVANRTVLNSLLADPLLTVPDVAKKLDLKLSRLKCFMRENGLTNSFSRKVAIQILMDNEELVREYASSPVLTFRELAKRLDIKHQHISAYCRENAIEVKAVNKKKLAGD